LKKLPLPICLMNNNKTMNRTLLLFPILFFILFAGCNHSEKAIKQDKTVYIKTHKVQQGEFPYAVHTSGKLASKSELKLSFKTGGIINSIYFDEGQKVNKGQTLAELKFDEIYAQVKKARLGLEKAKRDFERVENLFKDSVATLEQYQDMQTALHVAESNVKIAEFNLQHSKITAPEDGKILKKLAEENEMIGAGYPVFLFGTLVNDWIVKVNIVDKDLVNIELNDTAYIKFDAFQGKPFVGIISEMGSMADPYTGTYEAEIKVLHPDDKFASGFIAKIDIESKLKKQFQLVPVSALVEGNENIAYIYKFIEGSPVKNKVIVDHIDDEYLYVIEGISENDIIAVEGAKYITKNSIIKIRND